MTTDHFHNGVRSSTGKATAKEPRDYWASEDTSSGGTTMGAGARNVHKEKNTTRNVNVNFGKGESAAGGNGSGNGGSTRVSSGGSSEPNRHQGDRLIYAVERIEFGSDKDVLALAKAINLLGRELHLILGMRAEELQGVLSQYKGKWYTFGTGSRVKARLVAAHLKVSAEAAKAIGVGALKMAHSFNRHFVAPEQEAKRKAQGQKAARKAFTIGED